MYNQFAEPTTQNISATILFINSCIDSLDSNGKPMYRCNLQVSYTINNITYTNNITLDNSRKYNLNESVEISYQKDNPNNIGLSQPNNKTVGSISMLIGSLLLSSCACNYYMATNSNLYAAGSGVATSANIIKGIF
jgi:hypothetical protein